MKNLFGEPYEAPPQKSINKEKRNWKNRFQSWSNKMHDTTHDYRGKCGCSDICDYCDDCGKGRPCVRALNAYCRDKKKQIDYTDTDYKKYWDCDF